ncbi:hypothetical protein V4F39_03160 [Aquincola sp. MAHUQ-54]|uniref:Uncharacterized protein n=1 Tax=Aquincola agrisoli TaxID=3119538 RepID=A0AAW9QE38_9BURK
MPSRKHADGAPPAPQEQAQETGLLAALKSYENAALQYQFELQRHQARAAAVVERVRQECEAEAQRRWLEAYRSYSEALTDLYASGPDVQGARQAAQRWAEALHALYDVQPGLRATQEAGQSALQRLAEAGSAEGDAAERTRQVYDDYVTQLASIWDRRGALDAAQRAQQDYNDKLRAALEAAGRRATAAQQAYLAEVDKILKDDTLWRRLQDELAPIQEAMASALAQARDLGIDATIDGLRAYKAPAGAAPEGAAA